MARTNLKSVYRAISKSGFKNVTKIVLTAAEPDSGGLKCENPDCIGFNRRPAKEVHFEKDDLGILQHVYKCGNCTEGGVVQPRLRALEEKIEESENSLAKPTDPPDDRE